VIVGVMSALTIAYLITRFYGIFITTFTFGAVFLTGLLLTLGDVSSTVRQLGWRAVIFIALGRVCWETENNLCEAYPGLWPLHNLWHCLATAAATYMFLAEYIYRIEKMGAIGVLRAEGVDCRTQATLPMLLFLPASAQKMLDKND